MHRNVLVNQRDAAHELAEAMRDQALHHDPRDPGMDAAATLWVAAEVRAARLDRRCEIGRG